MKSKCDVQIVFSMGITRKHARILQHLGHPKQKEEDERRPLVCRIVCRLVDHLIRTLLSSRRREHKLFVF